MEPIIVIQVGSNKTLEYSIDGNEYTEFEKLGGNGKSDSTELINVSGDADTIIVRDKESKTIYARGIATKDVVVAEIKAGHTFNIGVGIQNNTDDELEWSIDNGENFSVVEGRKPWGASGDRKSNEVFLKRIIVKKKGTNDIIYSSPEIGEIEEEYIYENGKTTVKFNVNGSAKDETKYSYTNNGEKFNGNNITVEADSNINLKAYTDKEFIEQTASKDIEVKVVTVEKPNIEVDEDNNLILTGGSIINDELGSIYYSIDDEEEKIYTDKVKLLPGKHSIKAYQVSEEYIIESDIETVEVTIEDKTPEKDEPENNNPGDNNPEENEPGSNNPGDNNPEENEPGSNNPGENNSENSDSDNKDNENNDQNDEKQDISEQEKSELKDNEKVENSQKNNKNGIPQTNDNILAYVVTIFAIVIFNIVIKKKTKRK